MKIDRWPLWLQIFVGIALGLIAALIGVCVAFELAQWWVATF